MATLTKTQLQAMAERYYLDREPNEIMEAVEFGLAFVEMHPAGDVAFDTFWDAWCEVAHDARQAAVVYNSRIQRNIIEGNYGSKKWHESIANHVSKLREEGRVAFARHFNRTFKRLTGVDADA